MNLQKYIFPIPPEIIRNIEYDTREICANLFLKENILVMDNIVYGENPIINSQGINSRGVNSPRTSSQGTMSRASCTVKYYTPIIFHTHPRTSYATPSFEDIIKVLKHKEIQTSVIVTNWGTFQIVKMRHVTNEISDELKLKIKDSIDFINRNTVNPNYLRVRGTEASVGLNKNLEWNALSPSQKKIFFEQLEIINIALSHRAKIFLNETYIYLF